MEVYLQFIFFFFLVSQLYHPSKLVHKVIHINKNITHDDDDKHDMIEESTCHNANQQQMREIV